MSINSNDDLEILVDGTPLESVDKFIYLGLTISWNSTVDVEIKTRIGKAFGSFQKHINIWKRRTLSLRLKIQMYQEIVLSTLLYGSETWNLTQQQEAQLDAFGHKVQRRTMRVDSTNEEKGAAMA